MNFRIRDLFLILISIFIIITLVLKFQRVDKLEKLKDQPKEIKEPKKKKIYVVYRLDGRQYFEHKTSPYYRELVKIRIAHLKKGGIVEPWIVFDCNKEHPGDERCKCPYNIPELKANISSFVGTENVYIHTVDQAIEYFPNTRLLNYPVNFFISKTHLDLR